jgi:DNA-directed RNA polymerase sigma subunit (sigma70/sigma32)
MKDIQDLSYSEWTHLIDEWILNERDRRLIKRRLLDGIGFEQLAEEFYLSTQRTKAIVYSAIEKISKHL